MKIVEPGHVYDLATLDGDGTAVRLTFVNREEGTEHPGTQCQEVLRALIDRVQHCQGRLAWPGNHEIVRHLRMALVLFESRALVRKAEKGRFLPETVATGDDGHFVLAVDVVDEPHGRE